MAPIEDVNRVLMGTKLFALAESLGGVESLISHAGIPQTGVFHRALADAEMTAHLWMSWTV